MFKYKSFNPKITSMIRSFLSISIAAFLTFSCSNNKENASRDVDTTEVIIPMPTATNTAGEDSSSSVTKGGIKMSPFKGSAEFNDASLEQNKPEENAKLKSGDVQ